MTEIKWRVKGHGEKKPFHCRRTKSKRWGESGTQMISLEEKKTRADKLNEELEQWRMRPRNRDSSMGRGIE